MHYIGLASCKHTKGETIKTVKLVKDGPCRALRGDDGVFKESSLFWEYGSPSSIRGVGGSGAEQRIIAEDFTAR